MKEFLRGIYYRIQQPKLKTGYHPSFGFIFHTERIYHPDTFQTLLSFCSRYQQLTGKRPLCVVMSPLNKRIKSEMDAVQFSLNDFADRLTKLASVSDIGYHGHFWRGENDYNLPDNQVLSSNFVQPDSALIDKQFTDDYSWLKKFTFVQPYYSAGWWFVNPTLLNKLKREGIDADFSFSYLNWVSNDWTKTLMRQKGICFGESFQIDSDKRNRNLTCVQTLMGCTNTKYPQDFIRIFNSYLDSNKEPCGMIATHDYNLVENSNFSNAIQLIGYLSGLRNVSFLSAEELIQKPGLREKQSIQL